MLTAFCLLQGTWLSGIDSVVMENRASFIQDIQLPLAQNKTLEIVKLMRKDSKLRGKSTGWLVDQRSKCELLLIGLSKALPSSQLKQLHLCVSN